MPSTAVETVIKPSSTTRLPRVLLLSDVNPENTSGGQIVLYRHLVASGDFELLADTPAIPSLFQSKAWRRIKNTRFFRLTNTLEELFVSNNPSTSCLVQAEAFAPDIVMTVAHGRGYAQARRLANQLNVPLVTIYHDWWPDLDDVLPGGNWLANRRFHKIARQSALCLCVSDQMKTALASPGNTVVLPPIPGPPPQSSENFSTNTQFKIGYFGSLYDYGPMMADLAKAALQQSDIKLEIRGMKPNWPSHQIERFNSANILLPFTPRDSREFEEWLCSLDATLCVMSFDSRLRRRMETSFPSKLVESLQFGKPAIIWGPEYCSAIQWARERDACLCITTSDADDAFPQIAAFAADPENQRSASASAARLAASELNPIVIQERFMSAIHDVLAIRENPRNQRSPAFHSH